jgi:hypothetical protein
MLIKNRALLKTIFAAKGDFARGCAPEPRVFEGIQTAPFKNDARAAVCISGDFEMSWAWRGRGQELMTHRALTERSNIPRILELLDEYSIPITWATVGHLFLDSCRRSGDGIAHPKMPRVPANPRWSGDWYMHDPCSDCRRDPLWYAPDLVRQILESRTPHELGTHSFSHVNFSEQCSTAELIRAEIEACRSVMAPWGAAPRSLVFPHNVMGYAHLPLLAELGITAVRHRDAGVRLSYPERTGPGVYKLYESMHVRAPKHYGFFDKAQMLIQKAVDRCAAYCLWFHPSDPIELFEEQFRHLLQYLNKMQKAGLLWIATMADLTAYCEARRQLHLETIRDGHGMHVALTSDFDATRYGSTELTLVLPRSAPPVSAWQKSLNGAETPVATEIRQIDGSKHLIVNVPMTTRSLHLTFP